MNKFQRVSRDRGIHFNNVHPTGTAHKRFKGVDLPAIPGNKGNEGRFVRCKQCGFICDKERDRMMPMGSHAGSGLVLYAAVLYDSNIEYDENVGYDDELAKANGTWTEEVHGGCPLCGSFLYA